MASTAVPTTTPGDPHRYRSSALVWLPDALLAALLGLFAFVTRLNLPSDGLFHDDAWQVLAVSRGGPSDFPMVGQMQPGYTLGLMLWERIFGNGAVSMIAPALIAGALGPPALYLVLRHLGYARSISLLLGAALAAASTHIVFSDRVKTYTGDVLVVLLLVVLVPHLATRRWSKAAGVAWVLAAVAIATYSPFALLSVVAAGIVIASHPADDRTVRLAATGIQLAICALMILVEMRTYSSRALRGFWSGKDAFIHLSANPLEVARDVVRHSLRVVAVFPAGGSWWQPVALVVAIVGVVLLASRGRQVVLGRFLLLLALFAVLGAAAHRVPFGARLSGDGGRVALWLIPAIAVGIAAVLARARGALADRRGRAAFDAVAVVVAIATLASVIGASYEYPNEGARRASRAVMAELGPDDAVWITRSAFFPFALQSGAPVRLRATPDRIVGFLPEFTDSRFHLVDFGTTTSELAGSLKHADRVYVVNAGGLGSARYAAYLARLGFTLTYEGFVRERTEQLGRAHVDQWRRRPAD